MIKKLMYLLGVSVFGGITFSAFLNMLALIVLSVSIKQFILNIGIDLAIGIFTAGLTFYFAYKLALIMKD